MITHGFRFEDDTNRRLSIILDEMGYLPKASRVGAMIYSSLINSISKLGKSYSKALLYNMCTLYGLTETELLTNYDLFECSIYRILGKSANPILFNIKKEMLINAVLTNTSITESDIRYKLLTAHEIIEQLRLTEMSLLIQNLRAASGHIIYFYKNTDSRHQILSSFAGLDSNQTMVLSSECNSRWRSLITSYSACGKLNTETGDTFADVRSRVQYLSASTDMTTMSGVDWESSCPQDNNMSILCMCDIAKLTHRHINTVLKKIVVSHDYVIIDEPLTVYESRNMRKNKKR